jgi:hypothetical protein
LARRQLSYEERIEQIGNKLVTLALDMEKQAKEEGRITPPLANAMTNALRTSVEAFKCLAIWKADRDERDSRIHENQGVSGDLSPKSQALLEEVCELLRDK